MPKKNFRVDVTTTADGVQTATVVMLDEEKSEAKAEDTKE